MDTDFEDEFDQEEPIASRTAGRSRPKAVIPDGDDFPDEPVGHSSAGASGATNTIRPTNSPSDLEDEFLNVPSPVGQVGQGSDASDHDPHLLFPEGWDKQMSNNALDDTDDCIPSISEEASNVSQEMMFHFRSINDRIQRLKSAKDMLRRKFINSLNAGYDVESGSMELKHDKRKVKGKSFQDIASVLGETATDHLFKNLPEYERDFITVREVKTKKIKGAK